MTEAALPIRRALISVSDKTGIVEFARFLADRGVEILSTGGSYKALADAGIPVKEVSAHTGFPEIMDGRVKTLHPKIHGGLLARRDSDEHLEAMTDYGIAPIDLLVSNLYPFEATIARGASFDDGIENIDIGGPAMTRAAAKNHAFVAVVTSPVDYEPLRLEIAANGGTLGPTRRRLAAAAFARTAAYDAAIAGWFAEVEGETFPPRLSLSGKLAETLRYGENPHQAAALYLSGPSVPGPATAEQVQGKELSYNNILDADAAFEAVSEFTEPAVVIVKHANPCGVAVAGSLGEAYAKALACDPISAFGGIIAANRPWQRFDKKLANAVTARGDGEDRHSHPRPAPGGRHAFRRRAAMRGDRARDLFRRAGADPRRADLCARREAGVDGVALRRAGARRRAGGDPHHP